MYFSQFLAENESDEWSPTKFIFRRDDMANKIWNGEYRPEMTCMIQLTTFQKIQNYPGICAAILRTRKSMFQPDTCVFENCDARLHH